MLAGSLGLLLLCHSTLPLRGGDGNPGRSPVQVCTHHLYKLYKEVQSQHVVNIVFFLYNGESSGKFIFIATMSAETGLRFEIP